MALIFMFTTSRDKHTMTRISWSAQRVREVNHTRQCVGIQKFAQILLVDKDASMT
jgi:hypothetical protein